MNHKNNYTAHRWTVLASFFLWATNNWLEPHMHKTIKPRCLSVQPVRRPSAFLKCRKGSAKCLIQNDKDWTPNCTGFSSKPQ